MFYHRHQYTAKGISRLAGPVKPQLDEWRKMKEKHEQVAVGGKPSRSKKQMEAMVDEFGRRIEGGRN